MAFCPKPCKARKVPTIQGSNLGGMSNDELSSVSFSSYMRGKLSLYDHSGCSGDALWSTENDISNLWAFNDRVSSYSCEAGADAIGYSDADWKGTKAHFICDNSCHRIEDHHPDVTCGNGGILETGEVSACSKDCGGGTQTVYARQKRPGLADALLRVKCPSADYTRSCNTQACPTTTPAPTTFEVELTTNSFKYAGVGQNAVQIQFQADDGVWSDKTLFNHKDIGPGEVVKKTFTTAGWPQALRLTNSSLDGYLYDKIRIKREGQWFVVAERTLETPHGWGILLSTKRNDWYGAKESVEFKITPAVPPTTAPPAK